MNFHTCYNFWFFISLCRQLHSNRCENGSHLKQKGVHFQRVRTVSKTSANAELMVATDTIYYRPPFCFGDTQPSSDAPKETPPLGDSVGVATSGRATRPLGGSPFGWQFAPNRCHLGNISLSLIQSWAVCAPTLFFFSLFFCVPPMDGVAYVTVLIPPLLGQPHSVFGGTSACLVIFVFP